MSTEEIKKQFEQDTERLLYTELAKNLNLLVGTNKTSAASLGLFLSLPIKVELRKMQDEVLVSAKRKKIHNSVTSYIKHDDTTKVIIVFYYSKDSQIKKFNKMLEKEYSFVYLTYLYAREMMRISMNHNTKAHYDFMSRHISYVQSNLKLFAVNTCSYYIVNKFIYKLMSTSFTSKDVTNVFANQLFTTAYDNLTDIEILKEVEQNILHNTVVLDENLFQLVLEEENILLTNHELVNDEYDEHIVDLGESLKQTIKQYGRGTASAEIFGEAFTAKKVKAGWFKKLKNTFSRQVYYATNDYFTSWSSINSTYRKKFKSPKHKFEEHKLNVILSIDHSGSVLTEELQRLYGLIESKAKHIGKLTVLIHDTEIIKEFVLSGSSIKTDQQFKAALATRYGAGGTSHYNVFKRVDEIVTEPEKTIYMSFSDNYSDIPQSLDKYQVIKKLSPIWICSIDNHLNASCGGTNITLK
jgi:hypothetical protein